MVGHIQLHPEAVMEMETVLGQAVVLELELATSMLGTEPKLGTPK